MSRLPNWGKIINMSLKLADTSSIMHVANLASDYHSQSMLSDLSHLFDAKLITSTYGVLSQLPVINAVSTESSSSTEYEVPQHKAPHAEPASIVNIHTTLGPMPSCILQHRSVDLTVGKYNFAAVCGHSYPTHLDAATKPSITSLHETVTQHASPRDLSFLHSLMPARSYIELPEASWALGTGADYSFA